MRDCSRWLGLVVLALLLVGSVLGLSLYLDRWGIVAPGEVLAKQETITVASRQTGGWSRRTALVVRYQAADRRAPQTTSFTVDPATYDRLTVGAPLAVRYPPNRFLRDLVLVPTARPAEQSTWSWLRAILPPWLVHAAPLALIGLLLFVFWRALRGRVGGLGWVLAAYLLGAAVFLVAPAPQLGGADRRQTATATVQAIHPVQYVLRPRSGATRNAVRVFQPYELVELQFVPAGRTEPVVAVEAVDTDSVPGLAAGQVVAMTYAANDPRGAQLVGGRRTYAWKNLLGLAGVGLILAVVGLIGAIVSSAVRRRVGAGAVALYTAGEEGRRRRRR
jgi:disulfide bond formation protein DsbB